MFFRPNSQKGNKFYKKVYGKGKLLARGKGISHRCPKGASLSNGAKGLKRKG
jgi:hypothetical protein